MAEVLSNPELRQSLKTWGRERAKMFTWEASARKALGAFEALHAERKAAQAVTLCSASRRRPLLAFVAPLPPEPTGIAGYSREAPAQSRTPLRDHLHRRSVGGVRSMDHRGISYP